MSENTRSCWVVTDGKAGMESQCLGLAERLAELLPGGLEVTVKRIHLRLPWRVAVPWLTLGVRHAISPKGDLLAPPWPDILIATGRKSVPAPLAARKATGGRCFTVQIQNPRISFNNFSLVVLPEHDRHTGPNVVRTKGALHRVSPARLTEEAARFRGQVTDLPAPHIVAVLGGPNAAYRFDVQEARSLGRELAALARDTGGSLLVTPSRRTGAANEGALAEVIANVPHIMWNHEGENPYYGWLGLADAVVVSCDSVNMVCEAAATGKPVHVAMLPGGSAKFDHFHAMMREAGLTRPFAGRLEQWDYQPLDETGRVAAIIAEQLAGQTGDPAATYTQLEPMRNQ